MKTLFNYLANYGVEIVKAALALAAVGLISSICVGAYNIWYSHKVAEYDPSDYTNTDLDGRYNDISFSVDLFRYFGGPTRGRLTGSAGLFFQIKGDENTYYYRLNDHKIGIVNGIPGHTQYETWTDLDEIVSDIGHPFGNLSGALTEACGLVWARINAIDILPFESLGETNSRARRMARLYSFSGHACKSKPGVQLVTTRP